MTKLRPVTYSPELLHGTLDEALEEFSRNVRNDEDIDLRSRREV